MIAFPMVWYPVLFKCAPDANEEYDAKGMISGILTTVRSEFAAVNAMSAARLEAKSYPVMSWVHIATNANFSEGMAA